MSDHYELSWPINLGTKRQYLHIVLFLLFFFHFYFSFDRETERWKENLTEKEKTKKPNQNKTNSIFTRSNVCAPIRPNLVIYFFFSLRWVCNRISVVCWTVHSVILLLLLLLPIRFSSQPIAAHCELRKACWY